jgi:hypothetical protein
MRGDRKSCGRCAGEAVFMYMTRMRTVLQDGALPVLRNVRDSE